METQLDDQVMNCGADWWALYTKHQHEKAIAEKLTARGYDTFLPLYTTVRRWQDRSKQITLPLFPCYVFVRPGARSRTGIVTIPGVHMIVSRAEEPAGIPDDQIEAIRRALTVTGKVEPHPFLKCGDRVRMTRGSFAGMEGILLRKKNVYRLVLSIDMLARSVACEVDAADVAEMPVEAHELGMPLYGLPESPVAASYRYAQG